jgi:hypothetical protein
MFSLDSEGSCRRITSLHSPAVAKRRLSWTILGQTLRSRLRTEPRVPHDFLLIECS